MISVFLLILAAALGYAADGVPGLLAGLSSVTVFALTTVVGTWFYKRGSSWAILHLAIIVASVPATIWGFYQLGGR